MVYTIDVPRASLLDLLWDRNPTAVTRFSKEISDLFENGVEMVAVEFDSDGTVLGITGIDLAAIVCTVELLGVVSLNGRPAGKIFFATLAPAASTTMKEH